VARGAFYAIRSARPWRPKVEKKPVALSQGHRLEDGIPKEEEEKPRKRMLQQVMVQCNSFFACNSKNPLISSVLMMLVIRLCAIVQRNSMI